MELNFEKKMRMIADMQDRYSKLITANCLTKKAICDTCVPVRNTLNISDLQVLKIARKEMSLSEIIRIIDSSGVAAETKTVSMHRVQMVSDNYDILHNCIVKDLYPKLYNAVLKHDQANRSSWYDLNDEEYEEYIEYMENEDIDYVQAY